MCFFILINFIPMRIKNHLTALILILTLVPLIGSINSTQAQTFDDTQEHDNEIAIDYLKTVGIIEGYSDGTYKPERSINRAEFVKTLVGSMPNFSEADLNACTTNYFTDTDGAAWYTPYLCYAKNKGLIDGYPDGSFKPGQLINFAEASKIIANSQELNAEEKDIWYQGFVEKLEDNFAIPVSIRTVDNNVTRGEMAEILWRLKTENQTQASKRFVDLKVITEPFPQMESCQDLREHLQNGKQNTSIGMVKGEMLRNMMFDDMAIEEAMPMADSENMTSGAEVGDGAADYSETNVQVKGVDEADIIKNDGKYIYMVKGYTVRIVEAYPPSDLQEITAITLDDDSFTPNEIYVGDDKMVIIGTTYRDFEPLPIMGNNSTRMMAIDTEDLWYPYPYGVERTKVYIYNITDRSNVSKLRSIEYEGSYNTSRKVGDNLYMVMNKQSSFYNDWMWSEKPELQEGNIIPRILDSKVGVEEEMVGCGDIHYFPHFETPNYLIVSGIDISDQKSEIEKEVFLGSSENVFASKEALYVATSAWDEEQVTEDSDTYWKRMENTLVYKFGLKGSEITFKTKGKVPGRILNQFSMDEYRDYFRIATTKGDVWNDSNPSTNNLYVLDYEMNQIGAVEEIAPGEKIYSVRFMGDRAFMVTFKTVDPLFVISLKDPTNPKIEGKLKIPGWSDYLHPYDENHLIGFGKEVDESIDADKVHSDNAVYYTAVQGMKLSIFDVTDLSNPTEMFKEVIGARDTTSELLTNHKALLFDKEKEILAFPITVTEDKSKTSECSKYTYSTCPKGCTLQCLPSLCNDNGACTSDCGDVVGSCVPEDNYGNIQTVFQGAYVYNINLEDGFELRGKITHYDDPDIFLKSGSYFYGDPGLNIQRIVYIGEYLYSVSQDLIKASNMDNVEEKGETEID